jgi:GxxExxY protein
VVREESGVVSEVGFLYGDLTHDIIGAAMEVHRILGHGFLEAVYEQALAIEFDDREIPYERQRRLQVSYKKRVAGDYVADFVVDGKVIVELKAVKKLTEVHEAQLINYLRATDIRVGLMLNFGEPSLKFTRRIV